MRSRRGAAALGGLALAAFLLTRCGVLAPKCPACERSECRNMTFTIHLAAGAAVTTCCPRCGLRYIASHRLSPASLSVRAFDTADSLDAKGASYVEGSDVSPCTAGAASGPKDERGCCANPVYDRCQPSLIAFATPQNAAAFARSHGGAVRTFDAIAAERP